MTQNYNAQDRFPLVDVRKTIDGKWNQVNTNEQIQVPSSEPYQIILNEVPDNGAVNSAPIITGLSETKKYPPQNGEFFVNYATGILEFNSAQAGQSYTVNYWMKGSLRTALDINYIYNKLADFEFKKDDTQIDIQDDGSNPGLIRVIVDDTEIALFTEEGLKLNKGVTIDEFSDDETLFTESSKSVVTERAIKMYIDSLFDEGANLDQWLSAKTTDDISEGTTNKYYHSSLFDTDFANKTTDDLSEGSTNKYYSSSLFDQDWDLKTTDDLQEGAYQIFYTNERVDDRVAVLLQDNDYVTWSYDDAAGALFAQIHLGKFTTDEVSEGNNNLYFTIERAQDAIASAVQSTDTISYNYDDSNNTLIFNVVPDNVTIENTSNGIRVINDSITIDKLASNIDATGKGFDADKVDGRNVDDTNENSDSLWTSAQIVSYIQDKINGLSWLDSAKSFYNPTGGLPTSPQEGDRYISTASANGWTKNYVYRYIDGDWEEFIPSEGTAIRIDNEDKNYQFNGTNWVVFGSTVNHNALSNLQGGTTSEYYHLNSNEFTKLTTGEITNLHKHTHNEIDDWNTQFNSDFDDRLNSKNTDDLSEGTGNLYHTNLRAQDAIGSIVQSGTGSTWEYQSGSSLKVNVNLNPFTTDNLSEGSSNRYYSSALFDNDFSNKTTDALTEGTNNLYLTNERVDDRVSTLIQDNDAITWVYDDANDTFTPSISLSPFDTGDLSEGSNLYFTSGRARDAIGNNTNDTNSIGFQYDSTNKVLSANAIVDGNSIVISNLDGIKAAENGITSTELADNIDMSSAGFDADLVDGKNVDDTLDTSNVLWTASKIRSFINDTVNNLSWKQSVIAKYSDISSLPSSPNDGDRYLVNPDIYEWNADTESWDVKTPEEGWAVYVENDDRQYLFDGTTWIVYASIVDHNSLNNLQGGDADEFYHLSSLEYSELTNGNTTSLHKHDHTEIDDWTTAFSNSFDTNLNSKTTDDLAEGGNLYFTEERAQDAIGSMMVSGTGTTWTYDDGINEMKVDVSLSPFSTDNLSEGASNLYYHSYLFDDDFNSKTTDDLTEGSTNLYYSSSLFNSSFSSKTTDDLTEGSTNLYYTDQRSNDATASLIQDNTGITWNYTGSLLIPTIHLPDFTTNNLPEGDDSLYFTEERVDDRVNQVLQDTDTISWTYDDLNNELYAYAVPNNITIESTADGLGVINNSIDINKLTHNIDATGIGFISDKVDGRDVNDSEIANDTLWTSQKITSYINDMVQGLSWQKAVIEFYDPTGGLPVGPSDGDRYISIATANDWTEDYIYEWDDLDSTWMETVPASGTALYVAEEDRMYQYNGIDWVVFSSSLNHNALNNLQGGNESERFHLTDYQHSHLVGGLTTSLHNHSHEQIVDWSSQFNSDFDTRLSNKTTDDLSEGTNLYHTVERVQDIISTTIKGNDAISWTYDDSAGEYTPTVNISPFSTDDLSEGSSNLYYHSYLFDNDLATKTTDDLAEGGNLYFTEERVDDRVANLINDGTGLNWSYNDSEGNLVANVTLSPFTTDNLGEGSTNKYFTNARAKDAVGNNLLTTNSIELLYDSTNKEFSANLLYDDSTVTVDAINHLQVKDDGITVNKLAHDIDATGIGFNSDKVDNRDVDDTLDTTSVLWTGNQIKSYVDSKIQGLSWKESVISFYDNSTSLPTSPSGGDRYIAQTSGNGWTEDNIYEWDANQSLWIETVVEQGAAVLVEDEDRNYQYNGDTWISFGSTLNHNALSNLQGGTTDEYYHLTNYEHTQLTTGETTTLHSHNHTEVSDWDTEFSNSFDSNLSSKTTDDLAEGGNLYYTDERVDDRVSTLIQDNTGISWTYDDSSNIFTPTINLGDFSTTDLPEGNNLYFTKQRVSNTIVDGTGITWAFDGTNLTPTVTLTPFNTGSLSEGSNLYFTDERAQDAVGNSLTNTDSISFTYDDASNLISADTNVDNSTVEISSTNGIQLANNGITVDKLAHDIDATGIGFDADKVDNRDVDDSQSTTSVLWTGNQIKSYVDSTINGLDWQESVIDFYDNSTSLPASPSGGDRYVALYDAQNWVTNYIYEWDADTESWIEIIPDIGTALYVETKDKNYIYNDQWILFSSITNHNALSNLQGGTDKEFYHLTETQHTGLTNGETTTLHLHTHNEISDWNTAFTNSFDSNLISKNTDDLAEGSSNLYFTNARIDDHLSGGIGIVYNSGEISIDDTGINHNNLSGLQGGISSEFYHLTQSEYTGLTDGNDASTLHHHDSLYYQQSEVDTKLDTKIDVAPSGSSGNIAEIDSNGGITDSGYTSEDFLNSSDGIGTIDNLFSAIETTTKSYSGTSAVMLPFNTCNVNTGINYSYTTGSSQIEILTDGYYTITYDATVGWDSNNQSRVDYDFILQQDNTGVGDSFVDIPGSYIRQTDKDYWTSSLNYNQTSKTITRYFSSGTLIRLKFDFEDNDTLEIPSDSLGLMIKKET